QKQGNAITSTQVGEATSSRADGDVEVPYCIAIVRSKRGTVIPFFGLLKYEVQVGFRLGNSHPRFETPDGREPRSTPCIAPVASAHNLRLHTQGNVHRHLLTYDIALKPRRRHACYRERRPVQPDIAAD